jgi:hypothetical protein
LQSRREPRRKRDTQIRSAGFDLFETRTFDDRLERATDGFDFRKFGHADRPYCRSAANRE